MESRTIVVALVLCSSVACAHRVRHHSSTVHGTAEASNTAEKPEKTAEEPVAKAETQKEARVEAPVEAKVTPKTEDTAASHPKTEVKAGEPKRTREDILRQARKEGAPERIDIPKEVAGTYSGHKHRAGIEKIEGEMCNITADKQVSLTILGDGTTRWSGLTLLDVRCPGDDKDKPLPLPCWYEGQGVVWKTAAKKYQIRATIDQRGPVDPSAAFRAYKCKKGEMGLDKRWSVNLPPDCVAHERAPDGTRGPPEGNTCAWNNEFKQLQEGALSIVGDGRIELPVLMAGKYSMTLDRISETPARAE